MIKLTESEWKKASKYIPFEIMNEIEKRTIWDKIKKNKIEINIRKNIKEEEYKKVLGEQINHVWAITPLLYKDNKNNKERFHRIKKSFTHISTGISLVTCKNRKACLTMWEELKKIEGINPENVFDLSKIQEEIKKVISKYKIHN